VVDIALAFLNALSGEYVLNHALSVYCTGEDRGGAAGFDGRKEVVGCMRGFILVASVDARSQRTAVNVYDLRNKFVAFHLLLQAGVSVTAVACRGADSSSSSGSSSSSSSGNCAYVVTSQGTLMLLKERCAPFFATLRNVLRNVLLHASKSALHIWHVHNATVLLCTIQSSIHCCKHDAVMAFNDHQWR
jgi:hypothetical protein